MSRQALLNTTCEIYGVTTTTNAYSQFISTLTLKSTPRTRWRELNGREKIIIGVDVGVKIVRFYLEPNINIQKTDIIICNGKKYEVKWINILGYQVGLTAGLQVDCYFVGFCDNIMSSSSSYSSSSSSSSSISSSSSDSSSSSSSSY